MREAPEWLSLNDAKLSVIANAIVQALADTTVGAVPDDAPGGSVTIIINNSVSSDGKVETSTVVETLPPSG